MQTTKLEQLKKTGQAPEWLTEEGYKTLLGGYLLEGETPVEMYRRVAKAAAYSSGFPELEYDFYDIIWRNWLCLATPVASNMGTSRGLPISCNSVHIDDSLDSIFQKAHEVAMLSKYGAGVGIYLGDLRPRGAPISSNGTSEGIVPWCKLYDTTGLVVSQGSVRRGAVAVYLDCDHSDFEEFLHIRRPVGDVNRRCLNLHHAVCITDDFMCRVEKGDERARKIWAEILKTRFETGEPYLFFSDNVNRNLPQAYTNNGLRIKTSNICTEITLYTDPNHSFVCCLTSLNLARWDEWKNWKSPTSSKTLPELATYFLEGVLSEYIIKASTKSGFENAVRHAKKGRAIGIGVLGWHTLLQSKMLPFDSFDAMLLNAEIFRYIKNEAEKASKNIAEKLGEPLWCKGTGKRHSHLLAVAPTLSNSIISGGVSAGIEPITANLYVLKTAKGTFFRKNPSLEKLLNEKGKNTDDVWKSISANYGSVSHLDFLTDHEKQVFLTAREINQFAIIQQAAQRQKFIDQGQSVNLFFTANAHPKYIHEVHMEAWRSGLKTLYYLRTEAVLRGDLAFRQKDECSSCQA